MATGGVDDSGLSEPVYVKRFHDRAMDLTVVDGHRDDSEKASRTEWCEKHPEKPIELYCTEDGAFVCSICGLLKHKLCNQLKDLTDLTKASDLQNVSDQLRVALRTVDDCISSLNDHVDDLRQSESKAIDDIEALAKRLLAKIEYMKNKSKKDAEERHQRLVAISNETRKKCASMKAEIENCIEDLKRAPETRRVRSFLAKKRGQTLAKQVNNLPPGAESVINKGTLWFMPDLGIENALRHIETLGRVPESKGYKRTLVGRINVTIHSDWWRCNLRDCCLLPDGTLIVTDGFNKALKRVDPLTQSVTEYLPGCGNVRGVTPIGPREIAVSCQNAKVCVVSFVHKLAHTRIITMPATCIELAYTFDYLVSTGRDYVEVRYMEDGRRYTISKSAKGEKMFSCIEGIALDQTGNKMYISDRTHGLICIDKSGKELFRRSCSQLGLVSPRGVGTDKKGMVFVCGQNSQNVVQMTEEGSVIGEIMSDADGLVKPKCICFDDASNRIYVGGDMSELLVFQVK